MTKAKKNNKPWTAADDAELVLMREAKTPTKEIARALGRTPSGVMNRIQKKKNNKPWTYDMRASCYRQSADMQIPYRIQNTTKNQHQANPFRELDHSAYIEFAKGQLNHSPYIEFGEPDGLGKSLNDMGIMLNQTEQDIKPKPQWWKSMMWWRK